MAADKTSMKLMTTIGLSFPTRKIQTMIMVIGKKDVCEEVFVDLSKGEQKDKFAELMPTQKCPTLKDGEVTVWESNAILRYLATKYAPKMYPDCAMKRSQVDMALELMRSDIEKNTADFTFAKFVVPMMEGTEVDETKVTKAVEEAVESLKKMEKLFWKDEKTFITGDDLTIADIALYTYLKQFSLAGEKVKEVVMAMPKVGKWLKDIKAIKEMADIEKINKPLEESPKIIEKLIAERDTAMKA